MDGRKRKYTWKTAADHPNNLIPLGSLTVERAKEAVLSIKKRDAQVAMASLIANHGRKYNDVARQWCREFVAANR